MRTVRSLVLVASLAVVAAALAPGADADDCACTPRGYRTARGTRQTSGTCHVRATHHPSTRYVIPRHDRAVRSHGGCRTRPSNGPWAALRRYLPRGRDEARDLQVRTYFLRRYPFAKAAPDAETEPGSIDTLLAIGDEALGSERTLDTAGHLDRAMGRFFTGDYEGARADFDAVLAAQPAEPRAQYGLLMVAVCRNAWAAAARQLDVLAQAGELRRGDRIVPAGAFADAATFDAIVTGLRSYAGYRVSDGDAHLVTAWALGVQGKDALARRYARLAKRWAPQHAAIGALERALAPALPAPRPASSPATTDLPRTPSTPQAERLGQIARLER